MDDGEKDSGGEPVDERRDYEVGYGRPPKHGQIKPGEVRNPAKRRKGTRSLKTEVREMLKMPVPMKQGDKTRYVSTRVAGLMKLREKALKGDQRALERLLEYAAMHDDVDGVSGTTAALLTEDETILANARARAEPPAEWIPPQPAGSGDAVDMDGDA